jgi:hypothetical protein
MRKTIMIMTNKGAIFLFAVLAAVFTLAGCGEADGGLTGYPATWLAQQFAAITTPGDYTITVLENSTETGAIWFDVPGATVTLEGATGTEVITVSPKIGETFLSIGGGKVILKNIKIHYAASSKTKSLFYAGSSGALQIDSGAEIDSYDDIWIRGTFEMTGGSFTYRDTTPGASAGLGCRGASMTITGGTISSNIWAAENSTVTIGGGSGSVAITGYVTVLGANSSFEKKNNSTISDHLMVSTLESGIVIVHVSGPIENNTVLKAKVNSTATEIVDKTGDWEGYFQIRITGIPATIMADGNAGYNLIGMGPASELLNDGSNAIAGRDTALFSDGDNAGGSGDDRWYEFFMYRLNDSYKYLGSAGSYDLGFIVKPSGTNPGTKKVIRNTPLKVGELNTFAYTAFVNF